MSSSFSTLALASLEDSITPSQGCIKPEGIIKSTSNKLKIEFEGDDDVPYSVSEDGKVEKLKKATIGLQDCLACSGCITTAETVLITQQSLEEVYKVIEDNKTLDAEKQKTLVISISPQSKASLAVHNNLDYEQTSRRLTAFFKKMGFCIVLDTTVGRELSLIESAKEFVELHRNSRESAEIKRRYFPVLTSSCPGWVCYVEKTLTAPILEHLSKVKSAQQMTASVVKSYVSRRLNLTSSHVYHVAVAPCFDRKLEASRPDFYREEFDSKDVDCVLSTGEVQDMLNREGVSLSDPIEEGEGSTHCLDILDQLDELWGHERDESDGYLDYIARYATKELFGKEVTSLQYKMLRNEDLHEVTIYDDNDDSQITAEDDVVRDKKEKKQLLRLALVYGFRNLQSMVLKLKKNQLPYDYVEVMACPSGCINGGGQIKSTNNLAKVKAAYNSVGKRPVGSHPVVHQLYSDWLDGLGADALKRETRTEFRIVPQMTSSSLTRW